MEAGHWRNPSGLRVRTHRARAGSWTCLNEPLHESESRIRDLAPATVDDKPMPTVGHLDDLSHRLIAFLPLKRGIRNRLRSGVVFLAGDDQQRSPVWVLAVAKLGGLAEITGALGSVPFCSFSQPPFPFTPRPIQFLIP